MANKILIVDDSPTMRTSVRFFLAQAGYEVAEAKDGIDGLERLGEMQQTGDLPALIIADINMPRMNGIEFIREVKKTPLRFVPILVLTTEGEESRKQEGRAAGAAGWLVKPFQPEQLVWVVKKFVRNNHG